jgi:hypothetical protein
MRQRCGTLMPLLIVLLGLSACQSGQPTSHASPTTHPSATAATPDAQRCARLARRGFTPCPPTPDRLQLPPTTIRNATNGAVSDATAQRWGRAFQLAQAYYYWAMENNARSALTSGVLADSSPQAVGNLFGTDLMDLDNAKSAGGTLVYEPPHVPIAQIVAIPPELQATMQRQGLTPSSYGVAIRLTGPTLRSIRTPNGDTKPISSGDASYIADVVAWGELRDVPDIGPIWYEFGYYGCDGSVRSVCQL